MEVFCIDDNLNTCSGSGFSPGTHIQAHEDMMVKVGVCICLT